MYIVTAFALNYSTQNLGLPQVFLNIGLVVGGISCLTIPCFAWLADRFGRRRVYITGALIGTLSTLWPFFMALEAQSVFWIVFFAIMLANIAHDMVVCVQQPMFTELFGASYRYSGAGVEGIRWRAWSAVGLRRLSLPRW